MKLPRSALGLRKPRIEMLPLIDIVFLLLVFFIYAMLSMAVHRSLPVVLPVSATAEVNRTASLTVSVNQDGDFFLDKTPVSGEILLEKLQGQVAIAGREKVQVDIYAAKMISYQELYRVLDIIRTAGIANVSLQADSR